MSQMRNSKSIPILFHESYYSEFYGAQHSLYQLLRYIDRNIFAPIVVCPGEGIFTEKVRKLGVETVIVAVPKELMVFGGELLRSSLPRRVLHFVRLLPQVRNLTKLIRERGIQLMHCNTPRSVLTSGWAAKLAGIPLIWHVRTDRRMGYLDYVTYMLSDKIVTVTEDVKRVLCEKAFIKANGKVKTVYNGIPLERFDSRASGELVRRELGIADNDILIGSVGAISPRKGFDLFIEMAKILASRYPATRFVIVGDTPHESCESYKHYLQSLGNELIQEKRLTFTGWREDVEEAYAAMDIFVLPSITEGFGLVVAEAMATAKPVVRTDAAGARELVVDGETGYIVPINSISSLTEAVDKLVMDEDLRIQMGLAGRRRCVGMFSAERMTRDMEQVFLECLSKPKRGVRFGDKIL